MYQPKKYKKEDPQYLFDFIKNHPFASFILNGNNLLATHIPVLVEGTPENFTLYSHIAKHNEQFQYLQDGIEALIIFHGADAYISSSWYSEKDISTWDYTAVHVNVKLKLQTETELEHSLKKLVWQFEKGQKQPLFYEDIPKQILKEHLPQIIGFWAEPFRIQGIAKLHQGSKKQDVSSVIAHLEQQEDPKMKELSKKIREEHD